MITGFNPNICCGSVLSSSLMAPDDSVTKGINTVKLEEKEREMKQADLDRWNMNLRVSCCLHLLVVSICWLIWLTQLDKTGTNKRVLQCYIRLLGEYIRRWCGQYHGGYHNYPELILVLNFRLHQFSLSYCNITTSSLFHHQHHISCRVAWDLGASRFG